MKEKEDTETTSLFIVSLVFDIIVLIIAGIVYFYVRHYLPWVDFTALMLLIVAIPVAAFIFFERLKKKRKKEVK
jgi:Na+/melibiose symporter-like transporter